MVFFTHFGACIWLLVEKDETFEDTNFDIVKQYIISLSWAIDTMTGNSFDDMWHSF